MKARLAFCAAAAALVVTTAAASGWAQSLDCNIPVPLPADGRIPNNYTFLIADATSHWYEIQNASAGRSYVVEIYNPSERVLPGALTIYNPGTVPVDCSAGTPTPVVVTTGFEPAIDSAGRRHTFFTTVGGDYKIQINNTSGGAEYTIRADETTMFSPAWSTGGTYATYYSFFNTTNGTINVTLTLTTTAGVAAGTTTIPVPSQRNASTNTVSLGIPAGGAGNAKLTHNGPAGAILVEADIANFSTVPAYIQPVKFESMRELRR